MQKFTKGLVALAAVFFTVLFVFVFSLKQKTKNVNVQENLIIEPIKVEEINFKEGLIAENLPLDDESKIAYEAGYKRGYTNFMQQHNNSGDLVQYTYTSNESEKTIEENESYQELISKGYVDGYHKAGDSLHCPRYDYR